MTKRMVHPILVVLAHDEQEKGKTSSLNNKFGYILDHQTGSHMILWHDSKPTLSVPNHRELAPGLLKSLIRQASITVDEFLGNR